MSSQLSVPTHTTYFAGYLDAVGRKFTDSRRLCALSVVLMPSAILTGHNILGATPVKNVVKEFTRGISDFLNTDPRDRLVYYLIEYFVWYEEFSNTCVCEKLQLEGENHLSQSTAYRLFVDHEYEVIFLAYWKDHGNNSS